MNWLACHTCCVFCLLMDYEICFQYVLLRVCFVLVSCFVMLDLWLVNVILELEY